MLPGSWDIVGGHLEPGETAEEALAREIEEETGWRLDEIQAVLADWEWEHQGVVRHELDYLVTVHGELAEPRLEAGKHDASAWVGPADLELMMENRTDGDRRLLEIVALGVRLRLTERLRLEPVSGPGPVLRGHVADLQLVHADPWVAEWYAGAWSTRQAEQWANAMQSGWTTYGVGKWMAYDRATGELVGRGGLSRLADDSPVTERIADLVDPSDDWPADRLELGWALRSEFRGRGFATEIGRAGLEFAFDTLGARSVIAFTERHNFASRAVMERLGLEFAGEFPAEGLVQLMAGGPAEAATSELRPDAPFALYLARRA